MKNKLVATLSALLLCAGLTQAQTNAPSTNSTPSVSGGISEIWTALTTSSGTNVDIGAQTNWAVIPYIAYDIQAKKFGYGGAILYAVTPNFWAGVRAQSLEGEQTTAGVQCQLQISKKLWGITYTPFLETSVGIGKSALYGSAGPGLLVSFHTWVWGSKTLTVGAVGDYEHAVSGGRNWNQVNAGPLLRFSF
jgi:hypothetical protein